MTIQTTNWHDRAKSVTLPSRPFIDGAYVDARTNETFDCIFPGDGRLLVKVASCGQDDVDAAVKSGRAAFESGAWSRMPPIERKRILMRFSELILANRDELALLETLNVGKPIANSYNGDVPSAANCIAWYAEAHRMTPARDAVRSARAHAADRLRSAGRDLPPSLWDAPG